MHRRSRNKSPTFQRQSRGKSRPNGGGNDKPCQSRLWKRSKECLLCGCDIKKWTKRRLARSCCSSFSPLLIPLHCYLFGFGSTEGRKLGIFVDNRLRRHVINLIQKKAARADATTQSTIQRTRGCDIKKWRLARSCCSSFLPY